jgi:hypothetical protein
MAHIIPKIPQQLLQRPQHKKQTKNPQTSRRRRRRRRRNG